MRDTRRSIASGEGRPQRACWPGVASCRRLCESIHLKIAHLSSHFHPSAWALHRKSPICAIRRPRHPTHPRSTHHQGPLSSMKGRLPRPVGGSRGNATRWKPHTRSAYAGISCSGTVDRKTTICVCVERLVLRRLCGVGGSSCTTQRPGTRASQRCSCMNDFPEYGGPVTQRLRRSTTVSNQTRRCDGHLKRVVHGQWLPIDLCTRVVSNECRERTR